MEGSLQKIISAIVGVLILFIIPVYMAYEKIDDISYNLALKLTQNFVDNVRDKGYISPDMYNEYVSDLMATGNMYDIEIEHAKKRNDPAICIYDIKEDGKEGALLYTLDYETYAIDGNVPNEINIDGITYIANDNCKIVKSHTINEEIVTDTQITNKLFNGTSITKNEFLRNCLTGNADMYKSLRYMNENSYILSEGDKVNVIVKNRNQTIASIFYSMLTANVGNEEVAKIYVEYGGTIKNDGEGIVTEDSGLIDSEHGRIFKHREQPEDVTLDAGTYQIECWGAAGGGQNGGKGAYVKGIFNIEDETTLYVYVGGKGAEYSETNEENGGFNGGGDSYQGSGGGGATDVRLYKGEWNNTTSLLTRIIVAAGGGGSSKANEAGEVGAGGNGGNLSNGSNGGPNASDRYGLGANIDNVQLGHDNYTLGGVTISISDNEKGSLGKGGTVDFIGAGAGGSGYFGGSAAHDQYAGGGGGLSYIYDNNTEYRQGYNYPFIKSILTFIRYKEDSEFRYVYTQETPVGEWEYVYSTEELNNISDYINADGTFKNIEYIETITMGDTEYKSECKTGDEINSNVLPGVITDGAEGNGYVLIKKID